MKKLKILGSTVLVATLAIMLQIGTIGAANADSAANLHLSYQDLSFTQGGLQIEVCNSSSSTDNLTQLGLSLDLTNWTLDDTFVSPGMMGTTATTPGTFDKDTLTWDGVNEPGQCIQLLLTGHSTAAVGQQGEITANIISSKTTGDVDNTGTINEPTHVYPPFTIVNTPDMKIETRVKDPGEITAESLVTYQTTVSNIGDAPYVDNGFFLMAFVIPNDATVDLDTAVTDSDTSDALVVNNPCFSPGTVGSMGFEGLSAYTGTVIVCGLSAPDGLPTGGSYPIDINLTAGPSFAAGNAEVIAILEGNDTDTLTLFKALAQGTDPLASGSNNTVHLSYNPDSLRATVAHCPGQGEITTDGTGCFRVTFNKLIYASSFKASSLDLGGIGTVSSLEQLDDYNWEVKIIGIAPGQTLTLQISENSIQDLSAILSDTHVLGENVIRYLQDAPVTAPVDSPLGTVNGSTNGSTSANGTLAKTGIESSDYTTACLILFIGLSLAFVSRRKKVIV